LHQGAESIKDINCDIIIAFIEENRSSSITVNKHSIYIEICKQLKEDNVYNKSAIYERIYIYLKKAYFSIRAGTHIGQLLSNDSFQKSDYL